MIELVFYDRREAAMDALSDEIESELELVGCTAIEDALQGSLFQLLVVFHFFFFSEMYYSICARNDCVFIASQYSCLGHHW